jgi:hypothetical protein
MIALLDVIDDGQPAPPATSVENQDHAAAGGGALTEEPPRVSGGVDRGINRRGRSGRKLKDPTAVDTSEAYKGAASWFAYRDALIAELESAWEAQKTGRLSMRKAASEAKQKLLAKHGVNLNLSHLCHKLNEANTHGAVIAPERPGGVYLPQDVEERIVRLVRWLRAKKLPVFPEDVMGWATELIKGSPHVASFRDGRATDGWYRSFLKRQGLKTGAERPLETTRAQWLSEDNLKSYYDTAAGILVAVTTEDYNADDPASLPITITHPERIFSYDETRLELDCTVGGKGKADRQVRAGKHDDGEVRVFAISLMG